MKNLILMLLVFIFIPVFFFFGFPQSAAQEANEETVPAGMEVVRVGSSEVIVPKGVKVVKKGGLITLESTNEYVARQIASMDERLKKIELGQEEIRKEISEIKKALEEKMESKPVSPEVGKK